ncbi:DUF202 domain-containing protein [Lichenicoccus sp.]|uniref:DUF202 domain-containing protein n=1 Tax=Lichenicoccus sp. TaxID=2781899 RepID=UPI003D09AB80
MDKDQPADRRTILAEDRTVLAAERTYAAWLRTGLAFLVSGLAAQRVLGDQLGSLALRVLATVLIICATASFGAGGWRDTRLRRRLPEPAIQLLPKALTLALSALLIILSVAVAVLIWLR